MITQTAEYALRAVAHLAQHHDAACTTQQIAAAMHVPAGYLSKVLKRLAHARIVKSKRGLHGGFVLQVSPDELSVFDVIEASSPLQRIRECPLGLSHEHSILCPLHTLLDDAMATVEGVFREVMVSSLIGAPSDSAICTQQKQPVRLRVERDDGKRGGKAATGKRPTRRAKSDSG